MANGIGKDLTGKVIVMSEEYMKPEFSALKYRLFMAEDGFGCKPYTTGGKVFGYWVLTKERDYVRGEFAERFATKKEIEQAERDYVRGEFAERFVR